MQQTVFLSVTAWSCKVTGFCSDIIELGFLLYYALDQIQVGPQWAHSSCAFVSAVLICAGNVQRFLSPQKTPPRHEHRTKGSGCIGHSLPGRPPEQKCTAKEAGSHIRAMAPGTGGQHTQKKRGVPHRKHTAFAKGTPGHGGHHPRRVNTADGVPHVVHSRAPAARKQ